MKSDTYVAVALTILYQSAESFVINPFRSVQSNVYWEEIKSFGMNIDPSSDTESTRRNTEQHRRMGELTTSEQIAHDILNELSNSKYSFRIVVIGNNGSAILEATVPCLGPQLKILQSPSTGTCVVVKVPCVILMNILLLLVINTEIY
jgi:hypothetical protein